MATRSEKVSQAVEGALEQIKKNAPEEFSKLNADPKLKDAITEAAREAAARKYGSPMSSLLDLIKTSVDGFASTCPRRGSS